jgi:hypothetical protein
MRSTLRIVVALVGAGFVTRTLAWALHGAAFAGMFIAIEVGVGLLLLAAATTLDA